MRLDLLGYVKDHLWAAPKSHILHWMTIDAAGLDEAKAVVAERLSGPRHAVSGSVAVVPVFGGLTHRTDLFSMLFGGATVEGIRRTLRQVMSDDTVQSVILEFDSPGGTVDGIPELADEILALRASSKRVVSHVNTMSASAAYYLASQTDEIVMSPYSYVGSIGVYSMHEDVSKMIADMGVKVTFISAGDHKTEGNSFEPLSDEARADIQKQVNEVNAMFVGAVARGRNVSTAVVNGSFGQGRMFSAKEAVRLGMADRIATLDETMVRLSSYQRAKKRMAAEFTGGGIVVAASAGNPNDDSGPEVIIPLDALTFQHPDANKITFTGTADREFAKALARTIAADSEPEAAEAVDDTDYRRTKIAIAARRQARPDAA